MSVSSAATIVSDFYARLSQLAMQYEEVDNDGLVDKFIHGLKPKKGTEVELQDPQILEEASRIADRVDNIVYHRPSFVPSQFVYQEDTRGELMQLNALPITQNNDAPDLIQLDTFKTKAQSPK